MRLTCRTATIVTLCLLTIGARDAVASDDPAPTLSEKSVGMAIFLKTLCDAVIPDFALTHATSYAAWRQQHLTMVEKIERTSEWPGIKEEIQRETSRAKIGPEQKLELGVECERLAKHFETAARGRRTP